MPSETPRPSTPDGDVTQDAKRLVCVTMSVAVLVTAAALHRETIVRGARVAWGGSGFSGSSLPSPYDDLCKHTLPRYEHRGFDIEAYDPPYVFGGDGAATALAATFHQNGALTKVDNQWVRLMKRLAMGGSVHIVVLGGSETAGIGCKQPATEGGTALRHGHACAWSARLVDWLNKVFPTATIDLENEARGGTTTPSMLAALSNILGPGRAAAGKHPVDILLTEFLVNDVHEVANDTSTGGHTQHEIVSIAYEVLTRALRELEPHAIHMVVTAPCPKCVSLKEAQTKIATHYSLPLFDLTALSANPALYKRLWHTTSAKHKDHLKGPNNNPAHPYWEHHQYMADAVVYGWRKAVQQTCASWDELTDVTDASKLALPETTVWGEDKLQLFPVCTVSQSSFSAYALYNKTAPDGHAPNPFFVDTGTTRDCVNPGCPKHVDGFDYTGQWRIMTDRPGKPGWIATTVDATLTFTVQFGAVPRLAITFLKSYKSLGDVKVQVCPMSSNRYTCRTRPSFLHGLWDSSNDPDASGASAQKVSLSRTVWWKAGMDWRGSQEKEYGHLGSTGFGVKPKSTQKVIITLLANKAMKEGTSKFKVIAVTSC